MSTSSSSSDSAPPPASLLFDDDDDGDGGDDDDDNDDEEEQEEEEEGEGENVASSLHSSHQPQPQPQPQQPQQPQQFHPLARPHPPPQAQSLPDSQTERSNAQVTASGKGKPKTALSKQPRYPSVVNAQSLNQQLHSNSSSSSSSSSSHPHPHPLPRTETLPHTQALPHRETLPRQHPRSDRNHASSNASSESKSESKSNEQQTGKQPTNPNLQSTYSIESIEQHMRHQQQQQQQQQQQVLPKQTQHTSQVPVPIPTASATALTGNSHDDNGDNGDDNDDGDGADDAEDKGEEYHKHQDDIRNYPRQEQEQEQEQTYTNSTVKRKGNSENAPTSAVSGTSTTSMNNPRTAAPLGKDDKGDEESHDDIDVRVKEFLGAHAIEGINDGDLVPCGGNGVASVHVDEEGAVEQLLSGKLLSLMERPQLTDQEREASLVSLLSQVCAQRRCNLVEKLLRLKQKLALAAPSSSVKSKSEEKLLALLNSPRVKALQFAVLVEIGHVNDAAAAEVLPTEESFWGTDVNVTANNSSTTCFPISVWYARALYPYCIENDAFQSISRLHILCSALWEVRHENGKGQGNGSGNGKARGKENKGESESESITSRDGAEVWPGSASRLCSRMQMPSTHNWNTSLNVLLQSWIDLVDQAILKMMLAAGEVSLCRRYCQSLVSAGNGLTLRLLSVQAYLMLRLGDLEYGKFLLSQFEAQFQRQSESQSQVLFDNNGNSITNRDSACTIALLHGMIAFAESRLDAAIDHFQYVIDNMEMLGDQNLQTCVSESQDGDGSIESQVNPQHEDSSQHFEWFLVRNISPEELPVAAVNNIAICKLHKGLLHEAIQTLEDFIRSHPRRGLVNEVIGNLFALYDLAKTPQESRTSKQVVTKLAERLNSDIAPMYRFKLS